MDTNSVRVPKTQVNPVGSLTHIYMRDDTASPRVIRLDGTLARRRFAPSPTDQLYLDAELPTFGLRVRKGGGIGTWVVMVQRRKRRVRVTLGKADVMPVSEARGLARKELAAAMLDGLPTPPPKPIRVTIAAFADEFIAGYGPRWKASTRARSVAAIRREITPSFGDRAVADLTKKDIIRWRDGYAGKREAIFNRAVPVFSVMLQHAELLGYRKVGSNPCRGMPRYKRELPERYLTADEYRRVGQALRQDEKRQSQNVAAIRLLLFTGARRGEIETLKWGWVKPDRLQLPDSKSGAKPIYLNAPARAVIASLKRGTATDLVFPAPRDKGPLNLAPYWTTIRRRCVIPDVRPHDIRHSFASIAIAERVPLATIGKLLGHGLPETTARYAHLADDTIADAAQRVSGSIAKQLGGGR